MRIGVSAWYRSRLVVPSAVIALAAIAIGLVWAVYAVEVRRDRDRAQHSAAQRLESVTQALAEQTENTLISINIATLYLRHAWRQGLPSFNEALDSLRPAVTPGMELNAIVTDAQGWAVFATLPLSQGPVSYADRDHFRFQAASPGDELFVSVPVTGRLSGRAMIPFSRKIVDQQGNFAGTIVMPVPPDDLVRIDEHMNLGPHGGVSVVGADRIIRAAAAVTPGLGAVPAVGSMVPADRPYFSAPQGGFLATGSADGVARLFAFRKVGQFPLVVVATETLSDVYATLETHRRELLMFSWWATGALALFAAIVARLFWILAGRNRALTRKSEELERSNADLEQFAYVASHDLREPLRMVSSFMGLLERRLQGALDDEARDYLGFARDGAVRMDQMVLDLLDYARIGRERPPLDLVPLDDVVTEVRQTLAAAIADSGGTVTVDGPLPVVLGDRSELERLLRNLIGNSLKYADATRPPQVTVSAQREGDFWRIAVADNGIGIAPEHFGKIFGVFQRLHTRAKYSGTGIGLAICRKVVERHGGHIWVESKEGGGATFLFTLPAGPGQ